MVATWLQEGEEYLINQFFKKTQAANEVQTLDITADAGTYKLSFEGDETSSLAYNANNTAIDTALENLASIPTGAVAVTGSFPNFTITFGGYLAATPVPLIVLSTNSLTNGSSAGSAAIARTTTGAGGPLQYYWAGLSKALRANLGEDVTLADIDEVTGSGYARVRIRAEASSDLGWVSALVGDYEQAVSRSLSYLATGTWDEAKSMFLCTCQDSSLMVSDHAKVLDVIDLAASFTLANGQQRSFNWTSMFATPEAH